MENTAAAFGLGTAVGSLNSWLWGPSIYQSGYYNYTNPYCTEPTVIQVQSGPQVVVDYTQPIPADPVVINNTVQGGTDVIENPEPPQPDQTGLDAYEAARNLFYEGDYGAALAQANLALSKLPTDATLHQFRALCLFAQQDYRNAAAAVNSVLSVGPGWDWTTLSSLYASTDTYASQLRTLEDYVDQNPQAAFGHFLLAYHYVTCGYNDEAAGELRATLDLEPSDTVAANLLNVLDPAEEQVAETSGQPKSEVDPEQLFGTWQSSSNAASSIRLQLQKDGKFEWTVSQNGQPANKLVGEYSLADDKLMVAARTGRSPCRHGRPGRRRVQFPDRRRASRRSGP